MKIDRTRLGMAKRCLTSESILLIDGRGVQSISKIHSDLWFRYCMRMVAKGLARAKSNRKKEQNRRKR